MKEVFEYSPLVVALLAFLMQYRIVVRPDELEKKHREILCDAQQRFVSKEAFDELKFQFYEIKDKIDKIYEHLLCK